MLIAQSPLDRLGDSPWAEGEVWPLIQASFWFALLFLAVAAAVYVARKWRNRSDPAPVDSGELLTQFRDVHARGGLSDDEYKTIKSKLSESLRAELNDNDKSS